MRHAEVQTLVIYCRHCGQPHQVKKRRGRLIGLKRIRCCGVHLELSRRRGLRQVEPAAPPMPRPFALFGRTEERWECRGTYSSAASARKAAAAIAGEPMAGPPVKIVHRRSGRVIDFYPSGCDEPYDGSWCRVCGCTEHDCSGCIERTGDPCHWVEPDLCSACVGRT